jgi:hypothetical protein
MPPTQERAPAEPPAPSACRFLAGNGAETTETVIDAQASRALVSTVRNALRGRSVSEQTDMLHWLAGRSLLGLARLRGFEAAAACAYRQADLLASAAR